MNLFNSYNNLIIRAVPFIFNELIEKEEIIGRTNLHKLYSLDINDETGQLEKDNYIRKIFIEPQEESFLSKSGTGVSNKYKLSDTMWAKKLPVVFSKHEKEYIKLMLEDPEARSFLSEELIEKISNALKNYDVSHINSNYIEREVMFRDIDENLFRSKLLIITEALRKNKKIEYIYESAQGIYEGTASPYKLMYSLRERVLRLAACPDSSPERFILMNIDRFKDVTLSETDSDADPNKFYESQVRRLVLEVENKTELKAAERCMRTFSSYKRTTTYNKDKDTFKIEVDFYLFDEPSLIKDILSLGSTVQVIEVQKPKNKNCFVKDEDIDLREKIINELKKMYNNMN